MAYSTLRSVSPREEILELRAQELKHGRVAMLACIGWFHVAGGFHIIGDYVAEWLRICFFCCCFFYVAGRFCEFGWFGTFCFGRVYFGGAELMMSSE